MGRFPPILCSLYGIFLPFPMYISLRGRRLKGMGKGVFKQAIYVHKLKGFNDPTKSFLTDKLLTALSRQQPLDIRLPITRPILHHLIRSLTFSNSSAFQSSLFSATFLVAFYGLFRIDELASKSTRFARIVVQYSNFPGGGYFLGGYVPPGTPNWHPVLKTISPKIDTPF